MRVKTRIFLSNRFVLLFFILYAVTGVILFDDYGSGPDEGMERQTSLVNYKYAIEKLHLPVSAEVRTWLEYLPPLKTYRDRYYGTALHYPLVLVESAFSFTLEPRVFYRMRHFYTFLNFYLAMICFYRLLKDRIANRPIALLGVILLAGSPRFFAESFYNNKDILFTSWFIFSLYFTLRWFKSPSIKNAVAAGIVLALTINTRITGIVLLPFILFFYLCQSALVKRTSLREFISLIFLYASAFLLFYLVTPNFWEDPLRVFAETFQFSSSHPNHSGAGNLFLGKLIDTTAVPSYIPVWIAVTTPLEILFFAFIGAVRFLVIFFKNPRQAFGNNPEFVDLFIVSTGMIPVIYIILTRVIVYNGWRHCYFCYPSLIFLAISAVGSLLQPPPASWMANKLVQAAVILIAAGTVGADLLFIIRNHPYEYTYFNPLIRPRAGLFSGDYWGISTRQLLEYIASSDSGSIIRVDHSLTNSGSINRGNLPAEDRSRLELVYDSAEADYILFIRDEKTFHAEDFPDFDTVYTIWVEGDPIGRVLKRKESGL